MHLTGVSLGPVKDRVLVRRIAPFILAGLASLASIAPASAAERTLTSPGDRKDGSCPDIPRERFFDIRSPRATGGA